MAARPSGSPPGSRATSGRAVAGSRAMRATGRANWRPAAPAQRCRVPGIERARGQDGSGTGRRRDADDSADIAQVGRVVEEHDRLGASSRENGGGIDLRAPRQGDDAGAGRHGCQPDEQLRRDRRREVVDLLGDIGREVGGEPRQRRGIGRHRGLDHRPEAQRVLQRMKAFEHGEGRILARPPEALDQQAGPGRRKPAGQRFGTS